MAQFKRTFKVDLAKRTFIQLGGNLVFNADDNSNIVKAEVYENGEPVTLAGTVVGAVIRPNGTSVPITNGTISGNVAQITLTQACFAQVGQIGVGIQVVDNGVATTLLKVLYTVDRFDTNQVVDPSSEITISVSTLVSDIATAVASIPADYSDLLATIAPAFNTSTVYARGRYVWYDGALYRFTADHAAGAWNAAQVEAAVITNALYSFADDGDGNITIS